MYPPEELGPIEQALSDIVRRPKIYIDDDKAESIGNPGEEARSINHNFPAPPPLPAHCQNYSQSESDSERNSQNDSKVFVEANKVSENSNKNTSQLRLQH